MSDEVEWPSSEPDEIDLFYKDLGKELIKGEVALLRDLLHKFITLDTALLGGGLLLLNDAVLPSWNRATVIGLFLLSLLAALLGMMPYTTQGNLLQPDLTRRGLESASRSKHRCLVWSACFLFGGFAVALLGLFIRLF